VTNPGDEVSTAEDAAGLSSFRDGERVLLMDARGRRYLLRLQAGSTFHFHGGSIPHDAVIGAPEGSVRRATSGARLTALRPTLADFVLKMPRGAQVVYPKDIAAVLVHGDIAPGSRVLEAGTGSGALTMGLARAVGPEGTIVSYEIRDDFHATARANLETFFGAVPAWVDLRNRDLSAVAAEDARARRAEVFDRAVLDLPEPWAVLPAVTAVLRPGSILTTYLPTTNQTREAVLALERTGYSQIDTFEVLERHWHVTDRSVRPDHRMVAHTGFITVARRGVGDADRSNGDEAGDESGAGTDTAAAD
jgi:tRNA (adenine57-N1/adenine58-N1)-methyltransferase catalytic subunit